MIGVTLVILFLVGCGTPTATPTPVTCESGPDFVMHRALADMNGRGYELKGIYPATDGTESVQDPESGEIMWQSRNLEIRMVGSPSVTVSGDGELRAFHGDYIVSLEYRPQGSNDSWVRAQRSRRTRQHVLSTREQSRYLPQQIPYAEALFVGRLYGLLARASVRYTSIVTSTALLS